MSHIPIDFGRPFDIELFPPPLTWRVSHCWNDICPHQRYLRDG